ncbi:hypothetical protein HanXRQr2_Chr15g0697791 [Helianthus annuus]|uniref:Uncharacterized protein n=1 Tax=Helianthus annuus TaxID=4232 RepID=A0A9K3H3M0_HELAN|nr:hypothetical protein HanXRQr2_Chr15g0697791 [Helianthus annuus]KAJ0930550.1 hypothetical protein HanPSC8_Chr04g0150611 [Helianthus annuus]
MTKGQQNCQMIRKVNTKVLSEKPKKLRQDKEIQGIGQVDECTM